MGVAKVRLARVQGAADLCFFALYRGERFSLETQAFDSTGPMLKHKMLVEGEIVEGGRECDGLRLNGMTSALPEISLECDEIRPFETRFAAPTDFDDDAQELAESLLANPEQSVRPVDSGVPEFTATPPRAWEMIYTFDSDRGDGPSLQALVALVQAAVQDNAPSINVHGYRGSSLLDSGEILEEPSGLARQRAVKIAQIISGLGYPESKINIAWSEDAEAPDGRTDWRRRRVTVAVR